jgi:hypothetical protein
MDGSSHPLTDFMPTRVAVGQSIEQNDTHTAAVGVATPHPSPKYIFLFQFTGIYYAVTMVLTTAATVLGVVVLRIHHQAGLHTTSLLNLKGQSLFPDLSLLESSFLQDRIITAGGPKI